MKKERFLEKRDDMVESKENTAPTVSHTRIVREMVA